MAENVSMDESSSDEEPFQKKARAKFKIPKEVSSGDHIAEKSDEKRGRGQETVDRFGRFFGDGQENYDRFWRFPGDYGQDGNDSYGRFIDGRGRGLNVGGRFRGGRCGGQGYCGGC
ncbi:hypothetical protein Bca4012_009393 [Brassica carinata]|uniref:Uncharacterized protein n=1 Tax=Brassica carinata TaxID=52824 RepID=A0A8X7S1B6_BRACI|nr:hypothetical protein Bca52824_034662 [Brassica carinata]